MRLLHDAEETCNVLIDSVSLDKEVKSWWKFAFKCCYQKCAMLAAVMEFAKPRKYMEQFALPALKLWLKKFYPELDFASDKVLPDNYYSF
jgi:hypothetical protein